MENTSVQTTKEIEDTSINFYSVKLPDETKKVQYDSCDQLNHLFIGQDQEQKTIQEAREILGKSAQNLSDEQVKDLVTEIQYLVDSWLEEYEKETFNEKSLNELLNLDK